MSESKITGMPVDLKDMLDPYLKDSLVTLLENRPEDPIRFLAEYFRNATKGMKSVARSYRYIRLTKHNRDAFMENLASAFRAMDAERGVGASKKSSIASPGVTQSQFKKLVEMLCDDFPLDVIDGIFQIMGKRKDDPIDFREFCGGVLACLIYEEFFEQVEWLFKCADTSGSGTISGATLMQVIDAVKRKPNSAVQIPSDGELRKCLREVGVDQGRPSEKQLCFQEFVLAMFKICIPQNFSAEIHSTDSKKEGSNSPTASRGSSASSSCKPEHST
mmetsp:Transcript_1968/g.2779  ORF Transcript_1968/g.2779 Transcript_1968/m.2779 type:complete len:275 (-) Transcript_1968:432-1256(-)